MKSDREILGKLARIRAGEAPRILDLFSGCGGMTIGLQAAGFLPVAGLDSDVNAVNSWYHNHGRHIARKSAPPAWDIRETTPRGFLSSIGMACVHDQIDIVCGGPPCQAYSRIGKAKLESLSGRNAFLKDERGTLFKEFLRFVRILKPVAVLLENVPDSTNYGGVNIPEEICVSLEKMGYSAAWTLLDAAEYGVPQFRQRVIVQALHTVARKAPSFPRPTHRVLPEIVNRSISARANGFFNQVVDGFLNHYLKPWPTTTDLPTATSVAMALSDLPRICPMSLPKGATICQKVSTLLPYSTTLPLNAFQTAMRRWPGFETAGWVSGNTIRNTPRDFPIFASMKEGDQYPEAHEHARALAARMVAEEHSRKRRPLTATEERKIRRSIVPPYDLQKFESKWNKLRRERPSHTVVAHLQTDTYSHIHYDSNQARAISVREAARLQSFPDGFRFEGSMSDAFKQIGNAVPPLLARALGFEMLANLRRIESLLPRKANGNAA